MELPTPNPPDRGLLVKLGYTLYAIVAFPVPESGSAFSQLTDAATFHEQVGADVVRLNVRLSPPSAPIEVDDGVRVYVHADPVPADCVMFIFARPTVTEIGRCAPELASTV